MHCFERKKIKSVIRKCLFYPSTFQIIGSYAQFIPFKLEVVIDFVFITDSVDSLTLIPPSLPPRMNWCPNQELDTMSTLNNTE